MPSAAAAARMARNGRDDLVMQGAGRVGELRQVVSGPSGQLIQREFRRFARAWYRSIDTPALSAELIDIGAAVADPESGPWRIRMGKIARK